MFDFVIPLPDWNWTFNHNRQHLSKGPPFLAIMSIQRLEGDDVEGIYSIMATPATEDADEVDSEFTIDIEESRRIAQKLVDDGVNAIMLNGTFGEAATLTSEEWREFTTIVVKAVNDRVPVLAGPTTLDTRSTIERAKFARDVGAYGLLLGRPMWCECSADTMIEFYKDVAKAVPELGIVIYDNPAAFKGRIPLDVWEQLAAIPQIIAAKYIGIDSGYIGSVPSLDGDIQLMPMERDWYAASAMFPDHARACWSSAVNCGPLPVVKLRDAIQSGDDELAKRITQRIEWTLETFYPRGDMDEFHRYNIPIQKIRFNAAGYANVGPSRRPYHVIPEEYEEWARISGERWKQIISEIELSVKDV